MARVYVSGAATLEESMRKLMLTAAVVAAFFGGQLVAQRADAAPLGHPAALTGAAEDLNITETVHCRRGWRHHRATRWHRADGCRRTAGVVVVPGRTRYIIRDGVRVRVGTSSRSGTRTTIRSKSTTTTTVRQKGGSTRGSDANVNVESGKKGRTSRGGSRDGGKTEKKSD
jgi:hypothetical protein